MLITDNLPTYEFKGWFSIDANFMTMGIIDPDMVYKMNIQDHTHRRTLVPLADTGHKGPCARCQWKRRSDSRITKPVLPHRNTLSRSAFARGHHQRHVLSC